jgi:hypothetical protein
MGFKNMKGNFTFADIALSTSMEKNRAIKSLEEINAIVNWKPIEDLPWKNLSRGKKRRSKPGLPACSSDEICSSPGETVYADKGCNRAFLAANGIADGIMRKAVRGADLTAFEVARNKAIAKIRYSWVARGNRTLALS